MMTQNSKFNASAKNWQSAQIPWWYSFFLSLYRTYLLVSYFFFSPKLDIKTHIEQFQTKNPLPSSQQQNFPSLFLSWLQKYLIANEMFFRAQQRWRVNGETVQATQRQLENEMDNLKETLRTFNVSSPLQNPSPEKKQEVATPFQEKAKTLLNNYHAHYEKIWMQHAAQTDKRYLGIVVRADHFKSPLFQPAHIAEMEISLLDKKIPFVLRRYDLPCLTYENIDDVIRLKERQLKVIDNQIKELLKKYHPDQGQHLGLTAEVCHSITERLYVLRKKAEQANQDYMQNVIATVERHNSIFGRRGRETQQEWIDNLLLTRPSLKYAEEKEAHEDESLKLIEKYIIARRKITQKKQTILGQGHLTTAHLEQWRNITEEEIKLVENAEKTLPYKNNWTANELAKFNQFARNLNIPVNKETLEKFYYVDMPNMRRDKIL